MGNLFKFAHSFRVYFVEECTINPTTQTTKVFWTKRAALSHLGSIEESRTRWATWGTYYPFKILYVQLFCRKLVKTRNLWFPPLTVSIPFLHNCIK